MSPLEKLKEVEPPMYHEALHAFAGGWDAILDLHGTMLYVHGFSDFTYGFEAAWQKYKNAHFAQNK